MFPKHADPAVSIVVLTFNKVEYTYRCLESLLAHADVPYELIIVDNASSDRTGELLSRLREVTVVRNNENVGFILGCNQGARLARGRYLLFLNNDTVVASGCLSALVGTADADDGCGAVGGKLIWPDGRLQEAGSILWSDGSAKGYGRGQDPFSPEFSYLREVDFCSGALLLVRRPLFERLGGFDSRFAPAYYEDADLCMGVRSLGYRVVYQPRAVVYHHEYTSSSPVQAVSLMERNQRAFADKWRRELLRQPDHTRSTVLAARDRAQGPRVLVVDDKIPPGQMGSGFPRAHALLKMLAGLGYRVTLFPHRDPTPHQPWLAELQQAGVEAVDGNTDLEGFVHERAGFYDVLIVSRPHNLQDLQPLLRRCFPEAPLIYDAEALFFLRERLRAEVRGDGDASQLRATERLELALLERADVVVTVSDHEKWLMTSRKPKLGARVRVWGHPVVACPTPRPFSGRAGLLFVGSFIAPDSPNEDAILYFLSQMFQRVRARLDCRLQIVGYGPPESVRRHASNDVKVVGCVDDLTPYYDRCRLFVVPHRFAAGIPLKLCEAMGHGLPAVVSELMATQLGVADGREVLVGRTPEAFADRVVELYQDEALWTEVRDKGLAFVRACHDPDRLRDTLDGIVREALGVSNQRPNARGRLSTGDLDGPP